MTLPCLIITFQINLFNCFIYIRSISGEVWELKLTKWTQQYKPIESGLKGMIHKRDRPISRLSLSSIKTPSFPFFTPHAITHYSFTFSNSPDHSYLTVCCDHTDDVRTKCDDQGSAEYDEGHTLQHLRVFLVLLWKWRKEREVEKKVDWLVIQIIITDYVSSWLIFVYLIFVLFFTSEIYFHAHSTRRQNSQFPTAA
jgi:hypothetical protein